MAKFLILENEINLSELRAALEPAGHEIVAPKNISDAMAHLGRHSETDLVVCAVHLRYESVFDFLKLVRQDADEKISSIPFVFYCAQPSLIAQFTSKSIRGAGIILGASKYITMDKFDPVRLRIELELCLPNFDLGAAYSIFDSRI